MGNQSSSKNKYYDFDDHDEIEATRNLYLIFDRFQEEEEANKEGQQRRPHPKSSSWLNEEIKNHEIIQAYNLHSIFDRYEHQGGSTDNSRNPNNKKTKNKKTKTRWIKSKKKTVSPTTVNNTGCGSECVSPISTEAADSSINLQKKTAVATTTTKS